MTFLRVLPTNAKPDEVRRAKRELVRLSGDEARQPCHVDILRSDDALNRIAERAEESDLLFLGIQRHGRRKKLFGSFTRQLAQRTSCPIILISRNG